jgi:hypothetical protein
MAETERTLIPRDRANLCNSQSEVASRHQYVVFPEAWSHLGIGNDWPFAPGQRQELNPYC